MELRTISAQEFKSIDSSRQAIADEHPRKFAVLDLGERVGVYGLGWNSQLIDPEIVVSADGQTVWLGVDQYLVAIDRSTGQIQVALKLRSNLLEIIAAQKLIAVRAETEVLLFNPDFSILVDEDFPDITEEISINDNKLEIRFLEGYSLTLDLQTGKIDNSSNSPITVKSTGG